MSNLTKINSRHADLFLLASFNLNVRRNTINAHMVLGAKRFNRKYCSNGVNYLASLEREYGTAPNKLSFYFGLTESGLVLACELKILLGSRVGNVRQAFLELRFVLLCLVERA